MRYHVLATDYDGTLAHDGRVGGVIVDALNKFLATGRRLVLVTGRELPELLSVFPEINLFEWVVAENGGLLYHPSTKAETPLAQAPSDGFLQALNEKNVRPISVGRVIVATWEPHQGAVLAAIHDQGLELRVIFNKGAEMILPAGVNKASGLMAALARMGISPHNVVGVGDAENDHAFLQMCEMSVAVANALPSLKDSADLTTAGDHGRGVCELIDGLIANDLADLNPLPRRHHLLLGTSNDRQVMLPPYGRNVLICGPSASGKSSVATSIVESLREHRYQFCLIDPEGDYSGLEGTVMFGGQQAAPLEEEVMQLLTDPKANGVVCLTGLPIPDRPPFFLQLLSQLLEMRARTPNRNVDGLIDLVRENRPDIFVTLESDEWWQSRLDVLESEYRYTIKYPLDNLYGMHMYSKLPLSDSRIEFLVEHYVPSIHTTIRLPSGNKIRIHFLHPAPPSPNENDGSSERDAELVIVARSVAESELPEIVAGDLNDVAWSATTRLFKKISGMLDPRVGRGMYNTFHADCWFMRWPLDHLFHSDHFTLSRIRRLRSFGSDHFPLFTKLVYAAGRELNQEGLEADAADHSRAEKKLENEGIGKGDIPPGLL